MLQEPFAQPELFAMFDETLDRLLDISHALMFQPDGTPSSIGGGLLENTRINYFWMDIANQLSNLSRTFPTYGPVHPQQRMEQALHASVLSEYSSNPEAIDIELAEAERAYESLAPLLEPLGRPTTLLSACDRFPDAYAEARAINARIQ